MVVFLFNSYGQDSTVPDSSNSWVPEQGDRVELIESVEEPENFIQLLIDGGFDIEFQDANGATNLMHASKGYINLAKLLLERGADLHARDHKGRTPLMYVMNAKGFDKERVAIAKLFLDAGADPKAMDYNNRSVFMYALSWGNSTMVEELVRRGVGPDSQDDKGRTPLMFAVYKEPHEKDYLYDEDPMERVELVAAILEMGVDPNARDNEGRVALMYATHGYEEGKDNEDLNTIVKYLLAAGADPNLIDHKGRNVFNYATDKEALKE